MWPTPQQELTREERESQPNDFEYAYQPVSRRFHSCYAGNPLHKECNDYTAAASTSSADIFFRSGQPLQLHHCAARSLDQTSSSITSRSELRRAATVWKRWSGSFSRHRSTISSNSAGISGLIFLGGTTSCEACAIITLSGLSAM